MSLDYQSLRLSGYLLPLTNEQQARDSQYVYVNGRTMRDRVINHAVRQAFEMADCHSQFVCSVSELLGRFDINVHPAKQFDFTRSVNS